MTINEISVKQPTPDGHRELAPELDRCRDLVRTGLTEAVPRLGSALQPVVSYHLGWTDVDGRPTVADTGKGLRGCLALLSGEAVGGSVQRLLPGAVGVELIHNFSLLHDDVIDLDQERRHRPTAWTVFGIGPAIVAGDALLTLALKVLLEVGSQPGADAASALLDATALMIEGQQLDLSFQAQRDLSIEDVLDMSRRKTGALIGVSATIGAILACADRATVAALEDFGINLGIAFQAVDDLLGTFGDSSVTGKDVGGDVRRRKLTLPLVTALSRQGAEAEELSAIMKADHDLDEWHVNRATKLIEACGGRDLTVEHAQRHYDAAVAALEKVQPSGAVATNAWLALHGIAAFSVRRSY